MSDRKDTEEIIVIKATARYLNLSEDERVEAFQIAVRRYVQALSRKKLELVFNGYILQEMVEASFPADPDP